MLNCIISVFIVYQGSSVVSCMHFFHGCSFDLKLNVCTMSALSEIKLHDSFGEQMCVDLWPYQPVFLVVIP